MDKKISKKERDEVVTKGFLVEYLNSKNYITKDYLDSKNYITKDYFETKLESTINKALNKQSKEFYQHMEALMEHHMHSLQIFMEGMDERYVLRKEWLQCKGI